MTTLGRTSPSRTTLRRTLFASNKPCSLGCVYCFAKFRNYSPQHPLPKFSDERVRWNHIAYPTCDSEFFSDPSAVSGLENLVAATEDPIFVSISVKLPISSKQARFLRELNERLDREKRGFIKCSVSLSVKFQLRRYEPRTPSYARRLAALKILSHEGIPTSVNLKPILPSVSEAEYGEIVTDTAQYVKAYLIGGLYIDSTTAFGQSIKNQFSSFVTTRRVEWLPDRPDWEYCENPDQIWSVRQSVTAAEREAFDTDLDVMEFLRSDVSRSPDIESAERPVLLFA